MTLAQRHAILEQNIQASVVGGWRPVQVTDTSAVLVTGTPVNNVLHLLLTVFTCGLWAVIWVVLLLAGGEKRMALTVDDYGNVRGGR